MARFKNGCIIDDDPISVFGIKKSMSDIDLCDHVVVFKNGQEALEGLTRMTEAGKKLPSIILLDINMPVMDGWEFLEDFVKIPNSNTDEVTIFIVSSSIDPRDFLKAKSYSLVSNYIVKPIFKKDLLKVLSEIGMK